MARVADQGMKNLIEGKNTKNTMLGSLTRARTPYLARNRSKNVVETWPF